MGESDLQNCHPHLHRLARSLLRIMEVDLHPVGSSVRKLGRKFSAACCALSNSGGARVLVSGLGPRVSLTLDWKRKGSFSIALTFHWVVVFSHPLEDRRAQDLCLCEETAAE